MAPLDYKSSLARYRRYLQAANSKPLWKASLYLILSLVLIIILILSALRPTLITIAGLLGQINQQQSIEQKLDQKIQAVTQANQELAAASAKLVFLDEALPTQADIGAWIRSVEGEASQTGVIIDLITLTDIPINSNSTAAATIIFAITAQGEYPQLRQFLQILQNLRRLITIEGVSLTTRSNTQSGPLQLDVKGFLGGSL